jgi:hypothetical protein
MVRVVLAGGVEVICQSLVRSSRQFISVGPSMISTIMQSMASASATDDKTKNTEDSLEGYTNFAPLGEFRRTQNTMLILN